uniref:Uncharacterized protein n=1 Tax=Periophthalmus magnuspinnatus TaxID=409849 RepID=A0A3B3ZRT3_9GOBI
MPPGRLPREVFWACPTGRRSWGRPRTCWRDYVSQLAWERLGVPPEELEDMSGVRDVWESLADPHFRMLCLFQGKSSTFRQMFSELKPQMEECLGQLEECAQKLDSMNLGAHISGVVSSTLGIIAAILGVIAIPLTGGTSLALTATGVGIGAASGIQGIVTTAVEHGVNNTQNDRAKEVYEKCMKLMKQILFGAVDTFKECIKEGEVAADAAYDASEGTLEVSRVVGKGVRLARVGRVVTEGLNVVFAGVDVYFLCSDIKGLVDGTETEVSKWIRARSGLCRAEIQSWQKTQDLIGQDERLSDQELLKKYFWPEQSPALL